MHDLDLVPVRPHVQLDHPTPALQCVDDGLGAAVAGQLVARQVRVMARVDLRADHLVSADKLNVLLSRLLSSDYFNISS